MTIASASDITANADLWADWLMSDRFSNDAEVERSLRAALNADIDRLLDAAALRAGMTLLDAGCGEGAVALRAIERIGSELDVLMVDVSPRLITRAIQRAEEAGVQAQCAWIRSSLPALRVPDACVDAVTTRAVLGYLPDKTAALAEMFRVLKPGGRISLAEPIRRDEAFEVCSLRTLVAMNAAAPENRFFELMYRWKRTQYPDTEAEAARVPMTSFSERDLVGFAMQAGFEAIHMEFHVDVTRPPQHQSWDTLLDSTPFPWAPTLRTVMAEQFNAEERALFEQVMRSRIGQTNLLSVNRMAFLSARKPLASEC
ncbi:class I SAM-dependent methyltransferase [Paraburkholderia acidisoli]|uniref:Methyltransferase domain-containing protein n=1 Tax=Paraburkholderia acidisoli TaxID=2571748 RepID=A0A7Z2JJS6_9BURK|nr:class I SAM-dependent methyltransferase [Paraburkholderia acidisoli]QGZ65675.1 methyltransferase domain-containing protein [Paraburkholderia acidisoli]